MEITGIPEMEVMDLEVILLTAADIRVDILREALRQENPDLLKHKEIIEPVIEEKQAELGNLYMEGFQLRNIQTRFSADLKALQKDGDE